MRDIGNQSGSRQDCVFLGIDTNGLAHRQILKEVLGYSCFVTFDLCSNVRAVTTTDPESF